MGSVPTLCIARRSLTDVNSIILTEIRKSEIKDGTGSDGIGSDGIGSDRTGSGSDPVPTVDMASLQTILDNIIISEIMTERNEVHDAKGETERSKDPALERLLRPM